MTQTLSTLVSYKPHKGQDIFHNHKARFRIMACGRRWGKTKSGANEAIKITIKAGNDSVGFIVAPTYWHTQKAWREFMLYCPKELIASVNRAERFITLIGRRLIWFKSADNPDSLRSEGLDWLWVDEGGQMKEDAWILALRPALMDKRGVAWFTGTPKGHNWYYNLWSRGQDSEQKDYQSWSYPSSDNPYLDPKEIEEFARDMPLMAYQQEILGLFIEDVGSVFRGVDACIKEELVPPIEGTRYVMGVDLAKHQDFTVVTVMNLDGAVVGWDRFSDVNWVLQKKRIMRLAERYNNARTLVDSTGLGDPIYDDLQRMGLRVKGYKFTSGSKADLIEELSLRIEQGDISYPAIPELINELKLFGYEVYGQGFRYGAPSGYHDDCVISLALAVWMLRKAGRVTVGALPW